ncbi:MAG: arginase family protein, partial [Candidatus Nanohalobium sp.]
LQVYGADEVSEFVGEYSSRHPTYLSVDIDMLKESEAVGTGYPDGQLSMKQVYEVIREVHPDHADLVEVAPEFDENGKTVGNARDILERLIQVVNSD